MRTRMILGFMGLSITQKNKTRKIDHNTFFFPFLLFSALVHAFLFLWLNPRLSTKPPRFSLEKIDISLTKNPISEEAISALKLAEEGIASFRSGNLEEAIEKYNLSLKINPQSASSLLGRGIAYAESGNLDKALQDFDKLEKMYPNNPGGPYGKAIVLAKEKKYADALVQINRAIRINPDEPQYLSDRGYINLFLKREKEAESDFESALKIQPNNPFANVGMGDIYRMRNELAKSAQYYEKAQKEKDFIPNLHNSLGSVYFDQDRFQDAIRQYQKELENVEKYGKLGDFQDCAAYAEMARIYAMIDNLDEAEKSLKKFFANVRKLDLYDGEEREYLDLLSDLGNAYIEMAAHNPKYYQEAIRHYKLCLKRPDKWLPGSNLYHNFQVGWCYQEMGNLPEAMKYFRAASKYKPQYYSRYDYWMEGHILSMQGKYKAAIEKFNQSLKVDPEFENAFYSRAYAYYRLKNYPQALKDARRVIELRREGKAIILFYRKAQDLISKIEKPN